METFLYIVFFISCIVLIVAVLLQPGKTDAGALFTSGVSSASLNPRGTASVLSKLTIGAATVFMLTALILSMDAIRGGGSVLDSQGGNNSAGSTNPPANENTSDKDNNSSENSEDKKSDESKTDEKKSDEKDSEKKEETKSEDKEKSEDKSESKEEKSDKNEDKK